MENLECFISGHGYPAQELGDATQFLPLRCRPCPTKSCGVSPHRAVDPQNLVQGEGGRMPWAVSAGWWVLLRQRGVLGPSLVFLTQMCSDQERWTHLLRLLLDAAARLCPEPLSMILR